MPLDDEIRRRLHAVVAEVRLPIDPCCRASLDALVDVVVQRMQAVDVDEAGVAHTVDRLRLLLDDMTQQSRILRLDALCEPTLTSAIERHGWR